MVPAHVHVRPHLDDQTGAYQGRGGEITKPKHILKPTLTTQHLETLIEKYATIPKVHRHDKKVKRERKPLPPHRSTAYIPVPKE